VTTGSSPARAGLGRVPYQHLVAVAFVFGVFMDILDTTVVNVALPTLAREFDAGAGTIEWVVTGYLLSLAIWIPASGWIGDRFGTKRTYLFALVVFTAFSALCGAAWNVQSLIAFRLLQGVGGGMVTPVGTAMLFRAFPAHERAQAAALLGVLFLLPLFLQQLLGLSAFDSGLTTFPQAIGMVLMTQVTSRLYPRVGPRRMLAVALAGLMATSALFLLVGLHTDLWWIRGIMFLRGVSMSFALVAAQAATFATISSAETGRASSLFNTNRQVAASVGVAVLATVLTERTAAHLASAAGTGATAQATLLGFHDAFAAAIVLGLLGLCFALRIRDRDAAASMQPAPSTLRTRATHPANAVA
jgi:MFS family permease